MTGSGRVVEQHGLCQGIAGSQNTHNDSGRQLEGSRVLQDGLQQFYGNVHGGWCQGLVASGERHHLCYPSGDCISRRVRRRCAVVEPAQEKRAKGLLGLQTGQRQCARRAVKSAVACTHSCARWVDK